ncbi:MAG: GDSL-type esterase/lipase family protein [Gallintestinimicrobium sp.]
MDIEFYNKLNQALHGDAGKIDRVMRFRYLNEFVKPGQILFAGSSLMEQFPIQEFVADFDLPLTIYNRGVGGFTTSEMLACMQDCVYALRPAYIFINIGTNDLNDPACTPDVLHNRYRTILSGIREHLPQAKLFLLAYYPVNPDVADAGMKEVLKVRSNDCICRANEMVKRARRRGWCSLHRRQR